MKMTDETLSAFLDGELPEADMQQVRARLADDPQLAERLAELSTVDDTLCRHYGAIDERPLPASVQRLLDSAGGQSGESRRSARVIGFPAWRRVRQAVSPQVGIAASIALALGFGLAHLTHDVTDQGGQWRRVAATLETMPSGESRTLSGGQQLTPRISFLNRSGEYCRQYRAVTDQHSTENVACRTGDSEADWELVASVRQSAAAPGEYQTASGGSMLDSVLDQMIEGAVLDPDREKALIEQGWQNQGKGL